MAEVPGTVAVTAPERRARGEVLLELQGLEVNYGAIRALKGLSLEVGLGEVVALIGANGAGKTSTLRAVSGMVAPAKGRVLLRGEDVTGLEAHLMVPRGLAHAPEGRGIFPNLTLEENLDLGAYLRRDADGIDADRKKCFSLFPRLLERRSQLAGTLSGGEQQMLAISRALMSRPQLLLLDEPSLGLAPQVVQTIFQILREVNAQGTSILLVEQNAHLALELAHWGYVLETGDVVMQGTGKALLESEDIRKAYLGE
jgi:branched-chain amino acid transport system ATP-binding protein